jgi:flagellar basal-body rod protein FlgG
MNPALWAAKTGLDAQQTRMAVVSNNLANVNTTGFKKSRAVFEDLLYQNVRQVGAATSQDTEAPSGMSLALACAWSRPKTIRRATSIDRQFA